MNSSLENEYLRVTISDFGGELQSLYGKKEHVEYLWQGDPRFWEEKAPNLFPYIARLTEGTYRYQGREYSMQIHGIVKYRRLSVKEKGEELCYELTDDEQTRQQYPFSFVYRIRYRLIGSSLRITYEVENRDSRRMYFGIGGHPGFSVPFGKAENQEANYEDRFEDYYLQFDSFGTKAEDGAAAEAGEQSKNCPERILFSNDCFVTGSAPFTGLKEGRLALRHELFDEDAIVLKKMGKRVSLVSGKSGRRIQVEFPDMEYLGIWHMPHTKAPYVCIEPWSSLPSRKGVIEDLEKQENLIGLDPGCSYQNSWSISVDD